MMDRRTILGAGAAFAASTLVPSRAFAGGTGDTVRVASLRFGSLSWLLETIKAEGLDKKAGVEISILDIATNQAGPVALLAGEADVIVSDWTWAMRERSQGEKVKFAPYSSALGALMVPKDKGYSKLADLDGKRLGVAGSAIDKSWLLLRAYSRRVNGKDIADTANPIFAAAPLITEQLRTGGVDAALNFWTYAARLSSDRFEPLVTMTNILDALEITPVPTFVGYVWNEKTMQERPDVIAGFLKAAAEANTVLATSDAAWDRIRPLVKPENDAEFAALKAYYKAGIPTGWRDAQTKSAEKLMALLIKEGDQELLGSGARFDPALFHVAG